MATRRPAQTQTRRKEKTAFLPNGVSDFLRRRAVEATGLALALVSVAYAASLITFNTADPSLNTAVAHPASNVMGYPGAVVSDLMLQSLGLGAVLPVPLLAVWGYRLMREHGLVNPWVRLSFLPISLLLVTVACGAVPPPQSWPLNAGVGGFLGGLFVARMTEGIPGLQPWMVLIGAGVTGIALYVYVIGIRWSEFLAAGRGLGTAGQTAGKAVRQAGSVGGAIGSAAGDLLARGRDRKTEPTLGGAKALRRPETVGEEDRPARKPVRDDRVEAPPTPPKPGRRASVERQGRLDLPPADGEFHLPHLDLLDDAKVVEKTGPSISQEALEQNARMLENVLEDFGVKGEITKVRPGPVVTLYELEPAPGTKTSRVIGLADDIARSMSAVSVRIATVPGRSVIGIELPNAKREMVALRELLASGEYEEAKGKLPVVLGKDIAGAPEIVDLATMPHLLVAGTTGSGKSVGLNAMILSLLYKLTPEQCRFIMIDPKMLELSVYDGIPHLLAPVVTDPKKAVMALKWTVREMEDRYRAMSKLSVRNVEGYNKRVAEAARKGEVITRKVQTGFDPETGKPIFEEEPLDLTPLPFIVVIVDEMADLMLVAGKDIEASIQRLAQMARAAGIHLIMATQRPSVDVITGTIKANFPTRISFMVTSKIDSRTILGEQGAEQLLGKGDMLYMAGGGRITRIHGPFVDDWEVEEVCKFLKSQAEPDYVEAVTDEDDMSGGFDTDVSGASAPIGGSGGDDLYDQAVALVAREGKASTSFIQRHFQIGYNRAARIIEQMEKEGVVSAANRVGKREVLVGDHSGRD